MNIKIQDFRTQSFWLSSRDYAPGPALQGDIQADVVIVGGMNLQDRFTDNA